MSNGSGAVSFTSSQGRNSTISRTITCTNCSVSGASVTSGSGFSVSRSGNTVTITRTTVAAFSGTVTVTGTASNGNYNAPSNITISVSAAAVDVVDLGLSVKWATMNVGASSATDYGNYYAWGEISTKSDYSWSTYAHGTSMYNLTKYNSTDGKTTLEMSDDTARRVEGGSWRMPTKDEWQELNDNCTWTWQNNYNSSGVAGYLVTSKKSGYTDKSIFLPAAGYYEGTSLDYQGFEGHYWSSSVYSDYREIAWRLLISRVYGVSVSAFTRSLGYSVRAVQNK